MRLAGLHVEALRPQVIKQLLMECPHRWHMHRSRLGRWRVEHGHNPRLPRRHLQYGAVTILVLDYELKHGLDNLLDGEPSAALQNLVRPARVLVPYSRLQQSRISVDSSWGAQPEAQGKHTFAGPGATQLTRIPSSSLKSPSDLTKPCSPCLLAKYSGLAASAR